MGKAWKRGYSYAVLQLAYFLAEKLNELQYELPEFLGLVYKVFFFEGSICSLVPRPLSPRGEEGPGNEAKGVCMQHSRVLNAGKDVLHCSYNYGK